MRFFLQLILFSTIISLAQSLFILECGSEVVPRRERKSRDRLVHYECTSCVQLVASSSILFVKQFLFNIKHYYKLCECKKWVQLSDEDCLVALHAGLHPIHPTLSRVEYLRYLEVPTYAIKDPKSTNRKLQTPLPALDRHSHAFMLHVPSHRLQTASICTQ